jgi:hypothetical protein
MTTFFEIATLVIDALGVVVFIVAIIRLERNKEQS